MKFPGIRLSDRGLQFKLTMVMLILFACSLLSVYIPYLFGRDALKKDLEKSFLELSNAISVSVDQLTTEETSDQDRLYHYVESLKRTGIREVSIVGEDMGVIDSTNPKAIGRPAKIKLPPKQLVINATFGDETGEKIQPRDLVVPVKVGGDTLGYIHMRMQIDDFGEPIRRNLYLRLFSTILIFFGGFVLAVIISAHYVSPVERLAHAAENVAAGDLSQELPVEGKDEVGRLTRSFNEMIVRLRQNRALEEAVRENQYLTHLGKISSGMAHEIRNPLNFIGLAVDHLDAMTEGKGGEGEAEKRQVIGRIKEEIGRLNDLVTNFILYGRPPELHRSAVRVPELAGGVLLMAEERLRAQSISCREEFKDAREIHADSDMLRRALVNLVGNAVDAMPNGGLLSISAGPRPDGRYSVVVEDTGIGIPAEERKRIFEPYFTTKASGLGLGLVLTKKIVDAHGGEIFVDSTPGKGTRIEIALPVEAPPEGAPG
ncbi:MAG: HAMP domain-containing histidine kinase [Deltaproteobacteria bacterium]|nr:HAMP domain-containing histidine kinase [Deltaproteobacteria bacterium]